MNATFSEEAAKAHPIVVRDLKRSNNRSFKYEKQLGKESIS